MKKLIATLALVCFFIAGYSQVDTLYTRKQQKIPCKIIEINDFDIKYKLAENPDGPMYVINKNTIRKYSLSSGFTELIIPDEMSIENEHAQILGSRSAIKIHPFSFVNSQISVAYEKVIKVGMNLDIEGGYINSSINKQQLIGNFNNSFNSGAYIKPGVKFFLGQDYSVRGLKYAHPLKGRYIKLDLAFSFMNFKDLTFYPGYYNASIKTNLNTLAYGGFVNYGRQFILGNILTLEYYVGVGFTGQANSYTNPNFLTQANQNGYYYNDAANVNNYHGFIRTGTIGLSFTGGFRVGYILPEKKLKPKPGSINKMN